MNKGLQSILGTALAMSAACNDSVQEGLAELDPATRDRGTASASDGGLDLSGQATFAVGLSDYESAGVALIDGDGKVLSKKYVSSGTMLPGLSSALHGDIGLPTQPCEAGVLTVLARYGGDYILQIDLAKARVLRQVATQGQSGGAAYSGNPQDILCFGNGEALVSRFEPSLDPNAAPLDRGDDLVRIDLDKKELLSRIDLSKLRGTATGFDITGKEEQQVAYARPGSIVRVKKYAFVGLSRLTSSFSAADGMLAIADLDANEASGFELPKMKNCGSLSPVAGRDGAVLVSCSGYPFGDRASAGIMLVSLDENGHPSIEHTFQADMKLPTIYAHVVSLGGTRAVAVATGDFTAVTPDVAYVIDVATGEASELFMSTVAGEVGAGAFRPETGLLLIPDAGQGVRMFNVAESLVVAGDILALDRALNARSVAPLVAL